MIFLFFFSPVLNLFWCTMAEGIDYHSFVGSFIECSMRVFNVSLPREYTLLASVDTNNHFALSGAHKPGPTWLGSNNLPRCLIDTNWMFFACSLRIGGGVGKSHRKQHGLKLKWEAVLSMHKRWEHWVSNQATKLTLTINCWIQVLRWGSTLAGWKWWSSSSLH